MNFDPEDFYDPKEYEERLRLERELIELKREHSIACARLSIAQAAGCILDAIKNDIPIEEIYSMANPLKKLLSKYAASLGEDFVIEYGVHIEDLVKIAENNSK